MKRRCGHEEDNHGPVGELAPGRKFNWNIFGDEEDCEIVEEEEAPEAGPQTDQVEEAG